MHHIDETVLIPKRVTKHRFRKSIIEAWEGRCAYCNCQPEKITLDHILAKVHGGTTARANLVPACQRCNGNKGHQCWLEWFRSVEWHCHVRERMINDWIGLE